MKGLLSRWLDYEGLVGQVARSQLPQCPSTCWSEESVLVEHQGLPKPAFTQAEYFLPVNISMHGINIILMSTTKQKKQIKNFVIVFCH